MRIFTLEPAGYVGRACTQRWAEHGHHIVGPAKDASPADVLSAALSADAWLLDLTCVERESELTALLAQLQDVHFDAAAAPRAAPLIVIGLSSVLTWNATQKSSKKSSKESNWKLRKSSPRYKAVRQLESIVLASARDNAVVSMVVAAGVLYGNGEQDFHHLFKDAWMHAGEEAGASAAYEGLPLIGDGKNIIPTIHVFDLVSVLRLLLENPAPGEQTYFLAVDQGHTSQKALVTAISAGVGDGRIKAVDKMDERVLLAASNLAAGERPEETANAAASASSASSSAAPAAPAPAATPAQAAAAAASAAALSSAVAVANALTAGNPEVLCADMKLESEWLLSQPFEWHCEQGPAASPEVFDTIRLEFVKARNLKPVRIMVTGGPGAGKSFYSAKLATQYCIPHLSLSSMLSDALASKDEFAERLQAALVDSANALKLNKNKKQKAKEKAAALAAAGGAGAPAKSKRNASMASAPAGPVDLSLFDPDVPRLPSYLLCKLVKNRVRSPLCRNKGFVLDGFPRTVEEARWFFSPDVEEDPETGEPLSKIEDKRALAREAAALAEEEGDDAPVDPPEPQARDPTTMVDSIVFLGCSESMAAARCKAQAAEAVIPGHNDEEGFKRRWARWATIMELNPATATGAALASANAGAPVPALGGAGGEAVLSPLSFVQDSVEVLDLSESVCADVAKALQLISIYCNSKTGRAANYHPTPEEQAAAQQARDTKIKIEADAQAKDQAVKAKAEAEQRARHSSHAALRRAAVLLEDSMLIEASSLPIRNYLMANVIPALVDGLLDVCKVQPEDPVDYLAEYLFKYSVDVPFDVENAQDRPAAV